MKKAMFNLAMVVAVAALPVTAQATVFQFNASLNQANELAPVGTFSSATGIATLSYNDFGTVSLADDKYDFSMSVFGLSGPATGFHIHGAATTAENAPVRVFLDTAPFISLVSGGNLQVDGNGVSAPSIPLTPVTGLNAGHPATSFLAMLQEQLAYVNVHTAAHAGGEIRGQFIQVSSVPEPETFAMLLAGLGLVASAAARRRKVPD
jgi:hypothetical protein